MRIPLRSIATLLMAVGVATCSDAPTGPLRHPVTAPDNGSGPTIGRERLAFQPVFSKSAQAIAARLVDFGIQFNQVHVLIGRLNGDVVKDTTVTFLPGQSDITLDLTVDVKVAGEVFDGAIDYTSPTGVVFRGATKVKAHAPDQPAPPQTDLVIEYVGPGASAAKLTVAPKTVSLIAPGSASFSATATDANGNAVGSVPLNWSTSDASVATISATGVLQATGKRGTVTVTATTPNGAADNASATISLPASGMSLVSGSGQTGKAGASLASSAVVRVIASDGIGVPGVSVNFAAPAGGSVGASSVTTDANGNATSSLKLGTLAGPQSFVAAAGAFSVSIPATATPGDPAAIVAVSGGGQSDTLKHSLKNPLVAKVTDQFNNPVPNVAVSWTKSGAGSLGAASSTTNADGLASVGYTLGATVGSETITASAAGVSATFTVQAIAGTPSAIAAVSGGGQTGRVTQALVAAFVVKVTDDAGNPVGGATVNWSATNGTIAATTTSDANGQSSNLMTLGTALGTATATASIANGKTASFGATAIPGVVAKLAIRTNASNGVAGVALSPAIQVELQDAQGNLTAAANAVTIALGTNATGATLAGTLTKNAVAGVATFDDLKLDKAGSGFTLTIASAGAPSIATAAFDVTVGSPTGILILTGGGQTGVVNSAAPAAPSVQLLDANKNPIVGTLVTFTPDANSGSVLPAARVATNAQGIATLTSWTFGTVAGPQNLGVSAPGVATITIHATAIAGAAAKLAIIAQPAAAGTSGVVLPTQPVIQVLDQFGNAQGGSEMTVTATPSTGSASGNTAAAGITSGIAAFTDLALSGIGTVTVTFSAPGMQSVTSRSVTVGAGTANGLSVTAGDNQSATVNTAVAAAPSVKVVDGTGNGVPGVAVVFTPAAGSGTASPASASTNAQGIATLTSWTMGTAVGSQSLLVTAQGVSGQIVMHATAQAGAAAKLAFLTSPAASAVSGVALTTQPVVQVQDQFGNAVGGGAVTVTATPNSGSAMGNAVATAVTSGVATFSTLTLTATGNVALVFDASGTGIQPVSATVAVAAGTANGLSVAAGDNQTATVNTAVAVAPSVKLVDANGIGVSGIAVTFTPATGSGAASPAIVSTDAQGVATLASWTLGTAAGSQSLVVTAQGVSGQIVIHATSQPGAGAKLAFLTQPAAAATSGVALATQPAVQVQDQFGNAQPAGQLSVTATPRSGTATGNVAAVSATTGIATFSNLTLNGSGAVIVDFAITGTSVASTSATVALNAGSAATMLVLDTSNNPIPSSQTISVNAVAGIQPANSPVIKVVDANGNGVAGVTVSFAATGPTPFTASLPTGQGGLVSLVGILRTAGTYTVTATVAGLAGSPRSATVIVAAAPASKLVFSNIPTSAQANIATSLTVGVTDSIGNGIATGTGSTDAVTLSVVSGPTAGTISGQSATAVAGVAQFTALKFSVSGTYVLRATSSPAGLASTTSATVVIGGQPTVSALRISTSPSTTVANNAVFTTSPVVQLLDANNNALALSGVQVTMTAVAPTGNVSNVRPPNGTGLRPPGPSDPSDFVTAYLSRGTLLPTLLVGTSTTVVATTDANGIATFSGVRPVGFAQTFAVRFTVGTTGVTATSRDITLGVGAADHLSVGGGDSQVGLIGVALPTAARARLVDTLGQATTAPAATVTFTVLTGGGSASASAGTNGSGIADATWTLGTAEGSNTLKAEATINGAVKSVTFSATAVDAHSMSFSATPSSSQTNGVALSPQPAIQLLDGTATAVKKSGVVITATVAPAPSVTGATFTAGGSTTATTDGTGLATFTNLSVSGTTGLGARVTFTVTSTTANTIAAITTDLTLGAGAPSTAEAVSALAVSSIVGNALASTSYPSVRVRDASGNIVPSAANTSVAFSVTSGSCSVSGQPVSIGAPGVAALSATTLTLPSSAGSCVIHAVTSPALTGSPFDFRVVAAPSGAVVWSGSTDDDFASTSNWIGGTAPTASSSVFIPRFVLHSPKMQGDKTVASLAMESGASFDVGSANTLTVTGTVDAGTVSNGAIKATGSSGNIRGTFSSAALTFGDGTNTCSYTLNGTVNVVQSTPAASGNVSVSNCNVDVSTQTLTVGRNLTVAGTNGRVVMQNSSSKVSVAGSATFDGAATDLPTSTLSDGTLEIGGDFTQSSTVSSSAFVASGSHTTKMIGTAAQTIHLANSTTSHFYNLTVTNASTSGTTITSIVDVANNFTLGTSGSSAKLSGNFSGGGTRLIVDGAVTAFANTDLGGLDSLQVTGNTFPDLKNTTTGKSPKMTKLTGTNVSLGANATVSGGLGIGSSALLTIGVRTLTIKDSLIVDGTLDMSSSSGQLIVGGLARFRGGSSGTHIHAGTLKVAGNFIEEGSSATSFAPDPGFLVQLNGTSSQDVQFNHPGSTSSRFANLDIVNTGVSAVVSTGTNVNVTGGLQQKGTLTVASGRTLTVDGLSEFQNGATTTVTGTLDLQPANFYNGSTTTGTGTLTVRGTCQYGSSPVSLPLTLLVGGFNVTSCIPGRGGSILP